MIARIQARRAELAAQLDQARQQYDQLEATLKELDRQLCAMAGGLQELDALLGEDQRGADRERAGNADQEDQQTQNNDPAVVIHDAPV